MVTAFTALCLVAVAALLVAERRAWSVARALAKTIASLAFVGVAVSLGATGSAYGRWVLLALALSVAGDVLLLSHRSAAFLAGLAAFLLAHLAFAAAFVVAGVDLGTAGLAAGIALVVGAAVLRWLWPHLRGPMRPAVGVYVLAILAMCSLAAGHAGASGHALVALAAVTFAASDLAVARDRFVQASFANRAWGLPAYYAAQLLLAASAGGPRG